ncbi:outer membrane protein assembly factor BamB family protein [Solitalea canadensis]|uniref:Calcineurin-like phosphoesterase n=1 Tax=Solitalea canadensis (strain ATCC 29591 / DSM 3403 / JCM 21819 / LMG 8368 / NBRC 15130 / NCIMB 12057 / USAM 9D) TaxID=929556 RepID=H8KV98_SOLCM|nr:PQQ-binding-like beta-propeller repeat protein [Solitalea canadensis]AFD06156.1 calcineurin-like phosphoesterase [Solitalea canadensis DSM 3403]
MNFRKCISLLLVLTALNVACFGQNAFKFAFVTDTHVGNGTGADDLRRTVQDINANPSLAFVVVTGDVTEFGADHELKLAKQILDSLNKKYYVIPGNHDANWSESGSNTFKTVFGAETFSFIHEGYLFAATSSGPNMRMSPGQIPRENVVWLDSVLKNMKNAEMPVIYLNHYPQDDGQNNWYEAINRLKKRNTQLILCGHGHNNHKYNFENIPGVMGRSNLRAKDSIGGYNVVTIKDGIATFEERKPIVQTQKQWLEVPLVNHHFSKDTTRFPRPSFAVNSTNSGLKVVWEFQDRSDVGAGIAVTKDLLIAVNTSGDIYALNKKTGKVKWTFTSNGKIYSTPAVEGNYLVVGSSNHKIYGLNVTTGKLIWTVQAEKAVVASPVIKDQVAYIGASDGHFRAIDIKTGNVVWDFDQVKGFVVTKPLIYDGKIYFGCWANDFYALDLKTGQQVWKWNNGATNRMFSPAACYPVATGGRVFIVAPDRYMTSLNSTTGEVIWRKQMKDVRARESMGLSKDSSLVYIKTMDGQLYGVSTKADSMEISWKSALQLPYELAPSAIVENNNIVYVPSHSGTAYAVDRNSGAVLWQYKVSNSLVNTITPIDDKKAIVSTMDGKITCLEYTR